MKAIEQFFQVQVLFIMLYSMVLTSESVDETPVCDRSNESYWAVLSSDAVYYAVQGGSNFWVSGWNMKAIEQYFHVVLFAVLSKMILIFTWLTTTCKVSS